MKKKILLVEENKALSFLIETVLEKNYQTVPVADSNFAMQQLMPGGHFDLVIISIDEVTSANFQLLHHLSTSSLLKKMPIVVLSNAQNIILQQDCEAIGISAFMRKPFDPQLFAQRIDELTFVRSTTQITRKKINVFNLNFYL